MDTVGILTALGALGVLFGIVVIVRWVTALHRIPVWVGMAICAAGMALGGIGMLLNESWFFAVVDFVLAAFFVVQAVKRRPAT